jgi:hypothetical protein
MHLVSRSQVGRRMSQGKTCVKALEVLLANERDRLDSGLLRFDIIYVGLEGAGTLPRMRDKRNARSQRIRRAGSVHDIGEQ